MRAWILADGITEFLQDNETHGQAAMRLHPDPEFRPLDHGWIRISGQIVQTGSLRNPNLPKAMAVYAGSNSSPAMVSHPSGNIEVPVSMTSQFLRHYCAADLAGAENAPA